jgi:hypothetical protein
MKRVALLFFAFVILSNVARAQFILKNLKELPRLKDGITYVVVSDTKAGECSSLMRVFKDVWTFNTVEFITRDEVVSKISPSSSFISVINFVIAERDGDFYMNRQYSRIEFWTTGSKVPGAEETVGLPKGNKRVTIGRFEMFSVFSAGGNAEKKESFSEINCGKGNVLWWSHGIIKNYLQMLTTDLKMDKPYDLYRKINIASEMHTLKNDTLFIPEYIFDDQGLIMGFNKSRSSGDEFLAKYKAPYKIISNDDLSSKILTASKPFYYFLCLKRGMIEKFLMVVNAKTGAVVYSTYSLAGSFNFKPDDMEDIYMAVIK